MIWNRIYALDLKYAVVISVIAVFIWGIAMGKIGEKKAGIICGIMLIAACFIIAKLTLFRESGGREVRLFPFRGSYAPNSEYPRTLLMNVLLFLPFGISFPYLLRGKNRAFKTAAAALGISFLAEVLQYVFAIGVTEADDLICNTAGALLGSIGYYISSSFPSMR